MLDRFIDWLDKILSDKNRVRQLVSASLLLFICAAAILTLAVFAGSDFRRNVPEGSDTAADPTRQTPTEAPTDPIGPEPPESSESSGSGDDPTPGTVPPMPPEGETVPLSEKSVSELEEEGCVISWGVYDPDDHVFARLCTDDERLAQKLYTLGSAKTVRVIDVNTYEDGGMEFPVVRTESAERAAVELYMGYILVDIGPDEGGIASLAVFSSDGKEIGIFSADMLVPALTRDSADHPLFVSNGHYLYIDEKTATLKESDYIDEVDGRGLYFDYNPDYGKSDSSLQIYHTRQTVKMTYEMDMSSYYTRYGVDYRIAREFQEKYPAYAEAVARNISSNEYYNLLFHVFYEAAKEQIAAEKENGTYEPLPQDFPWETTGAATAKPAVTTGKTPSATTGKTPSVTTGKTPAVTTGKGTGKVTEKDPGKTTPAPEPEEITVPEETHTPGTGSASGTAEPADITVPEPSTAVPTEKATTKAVTTKAVTTKAVTTKAVTTKPSATTAPASTAKQKQAARTAAVTEASVAEPTGTAQTPGTTKSATGTTEPATGTSVPAGTEAPTGEETTAPNKVISVSRIYDAYRFIYKSSDPGADPSVTTTVELAYTPYIQQTLTWKSQYKHAKAFNFSEGRAVTVTDNGIVRVINTGGGTAIYLYRIFKADASMGSGYMTEFFIEPARRDVTMLGYYYFDEGLMRLRKCNRLSHVINKYNEDRDILVDINGREYTIPEGYTLVSYSEGVLLLERQGRYGYFHKDGYWIAQPVYTSAMPFVEGVAVLGRADGRFGAIDKEGKIVIPFDYTSLSNASSGIFAGFSPARGWEILAKMTSGAEKTETKAGK